MFATVPVRNEPAPSFANVLIPFFVRHAAMSLALPPPKCPSCAPLEAPLGHDMMTGAPKTMLSGESCGTPPHARVEAERPRMSERPRWRMVHTRRHEFAAVAQNRQSLRRTDDVHLAARGHHP